MNEIPWTGRWLGRLARFATQQYGIVLALGLLFAGLSIWLAVETLEMQTGREQLIDPDRPAYERYLRFQEAYEHESFLIVLFDAADDPRRAVAALHALASALREMESPTIEAVHADRGGSFFRQHGLLYASDEEFDRAIGFGRWLSR